MKRGLPIRGVNATCLYTVTLVAAKPFASWTMWASNVQHPFVIAHPCLPSSLLITTEKRHRSACSFLRYFLSSSPGVTLRPPPPDFPFSLFIPPFQDVSDPFFLNRPLSQLRPQWRPSLYSWYEVAPLCVCVRVWNVFVCLSGLWLIRRLTVILWDRPVLLWWFAGLTHIPYCTYTQEYTLISPYALEFICTPLVTALLEGWLIL